MKKKKIWPLTGLAGVLVVLLGVYIGLKGNEEPNEIVDSGTEDEIPEYILEWSEEKTRKISVFDEKGEKLTFIKGENNWKLENYEKISLIEDEIAYMIEHVSDIEAEKIIENVEDLSEYGLDKPLNVVERETEDGTTESFAIGLHSNTTGCTYIYLNDKTDVVYAVSKNLGNLYKCEMLEFVEREEYPTFYDDNVKKVEIVKEEGSFSLIYDYSATTSWRVEDAVYGKKLADEDEGDNLASMVSVIDYSEFYEYDCQDFSEYGLDEPQMEIRVTYYETIEVESEESKDQETETENSETETTTETQTVERNFVISVGGYDDAGYYYVRMNDSKEVHGIAENHINKLLEESAFDYWALNMSEVSWKDLDYVEVQYDGRTYVMKKVVTETVVEDETETEDSSEDASSDDDTTEDAEVVRVTTCYVNDVEVDEEIFEDFYSNVIGIACQERMITCETENTAEMTLEFHSVDGACVTVSYIPWDENFYAVINNSTDFGLVNKMKVKEMVELFLTVVES